MQQVFFTADLHVFDDDISKYRGFYDAKQYRDVLASHWNQAVDDDDLVFILGDISKSFQPSAVEFVQTQLNGHKVLVPGNHDSFNTCQLFQAGPKCSVKMPGSTALNIGGKLLLLTHYPVHSDELKFYDGNIHGHIHAPIPEIGYEPNHWPNVTRDFGMPGGYCYFNANCEFHDYTPVHQSKIEYWYRD